MAYASFAGLFSLLVTDLIRVKLIGFSRPVYKTEGLTDAV
jgi:hypothetical protein